ncbi:hypothetical protein SUGI_1066930 [Cryptomeria japonica]|nr:hypothetical protein SUGI_1066930 [Cryptomeria japonica]
MNLYGPISGKLKEIFEFWSTSGRKAVWGGLWHAILVNLIWMIWKERNNHVFNNKEMRTRSLINKIETFICENINIVVANKKSHIFIAWDDNITHHCPHIILPEDESFSNNSTRDRVRWILPPSDRLKLNFDGASWGNPGLSDTGFILRNDRGRLAWVGSVKLPLGTNNDAKFVALKAIMTLCKDKNLSKIDVKGDSLNVIRAISMGTTPSWKSKMWTYYIRQILQDIDEYSIKHIFREVIRIVDFLSNHVIDQAKQSIIDCNPNAWTSLNLNVDIV